MAERNIIVEFDYPSRAKRTRRKRVQRPRDSGIKLSAFGYSTQKSTASRRSSLKNAAAELGWRGVRSRLAFAAKLNTKRSPKSSEVMTKDYQWSLSQT